jgi:hypothetical protein
MLTKDIAFRDISQKYINANKSTVIIVLTIRRVKAEYLFKLVNVHTTNVIITNDNTKC